MHRAIKEKSEVLTWAGGESPWEFDFDMIVSMVRDEEAESISSKV